MRFGLFGGATAHGNAVPGASNAVPGASNALPGAGSAVVGDSSQDYARYIDYILEAEALGFHSVFLVEHHFTGFNQVSASLTFLAYLAARTTTLRLGTAVTVLPWHNPALLAEQAATVDLLSRGRLDFGVGRGYRYSEFSGFCVPLEEADERYAEALEVIRKAWTTPGRFSHHGKRWHYENVVIEPAPTQRPHPPLWVGAGNLEVIGNVARAGFNLLLDQLSTPEVSGQRIAAYRAARAAAGLPFDPMQVALTRGLHLAMNAAERDAQHELRAQFLENVRKLTVNPNGAASTMAVPQSPAEFRAQTEATTLIGTPEEIIMRLKAIEAQGIEYVLLMDVGGSIEALRRFAREVMPAFAGSSMVRAAA